MAKMRLPTRPTLSALLRPSVSSVFLGVRHTLVASQHHPNTPWDCHICRSIDPPGTTPTDAVLWQSHRSCLGHGLTNLACFGLRKTRNRFRDRCRLTYFGVRPCRGVRRLREFAPSRSGFGSKRPPPRSGTVSVTSGGFGVVVVLRAAVPHRSEAHGPRLPGQPFIKGFYTTNKITKDFLKLH